MPNYQLHLENHPGELDHRETFDAADIQSAIRHALRVAARLISADMHRGMVAVSFNLCLDDETGERVRTMPVSLSVTGLAPVAR
jgi:hypothetical protein